MNRTRALLLGTTLGLVLAVSGLLYVVFLGTTTYTVKGRVAGVRDGGETLFVEHEKIPGYMPAMTMPLPVGDPSETNALRTNQAIEFRLRVQGDSAWISRVEPVADTAVARHPARTMRAMPGSQSSDRDMLREGEQVPGDIRLLDQDGEAFRLADFRGEALVLTFIYTRCPLPTYCPRMSRHFASLQPTLRKQFGETVHLLSVSFDPEFDRPEVLREYAQKYTDNLDTWTFATGDSTQIARITDRFGIFTKQEGGQITHNLRTVVIGPTGIVRRIFHGNGWEISQVMSALRQIHHS